MEYVVRCYELGDSEFGDKNSRIAGMASVVIDGKVAISDIRLLQCKRKDNGELFFAVRYPERKVGNGDDVKYERIFTPTTKELGSQIIESIKKAYESKNPVTFTTDNKYSLDVSAVKYEKDNVKGFATVSIGETPEIRVNNIRILEGKNGLFVSMPNRKRKDDTYQDIFNATTKEDYHELNDKIMNAYNEKCQEADKNKSQGNDIPKTPAANKSHSR